MSEFFVGFPFLRVDCCGRDVVAVGEVIGNGERVGLTLVLSACHNLGGVYLRYGAEVEACAVSAMIYNYRPAGKSYGMDDGAVSVFGQLMASPFVSLGWRL